MQRKYLVVLLKSVVIGCAVLGLYVCAYLVPGAMRHLVSQDLSAASLTLTATLFCWLLAVPIFIALVFAWQIFDAIGQDQSFTEGNAKRLRWISRLALLDLAFLVVGFVASLIGRISDPLMFLCFVVGLFLCAAASVICLVLSQLIHQAALLKAENDYII